MAPDLPIHKIFVQQKVPFSKISDDVITYDLWLDPPNQKSWLRLCSIHHTVFKGTYV